MQDFDSFDWSTATGDAQLTKALSATDVQLRKLARNYDWNLEPEKVLGWVMAKKCIDLSTALTAFLNGGPERFNYMPKRDVPEAYRGAARVLDNICLRLNSGFYLAYPERESHDHKRIAKWLAYQQADREERRRGRWILDENILATLLNDTLRIDREAEQVTYSRNPSLLRDILSPAIDLATKRVIDDEPKPVATSQSRHG
ncbi:hypothetical protein PEL8287_03499 [Roseovarius litorisediminis]|uniref:Uncharacterized protein n=1 Tax=Roseovarius litorisediminis TaxID=1312363 RepID=A0A1Y5THG7_9RHOB|nr:hypothetical protein [Roseovarius litorisediminis]SLN63911.1 hypothetical protein PEL8287_03499 [Roseovarius litorisediminis]